MRQVGRAEEKQFLQVAATRGEVQGNREEASEVHRAADLGENRSDWEMQFVGAEGEGDRNKNATGSKGCKRQAYRRVTKSEGAFRCGWED